MRYVYILKYLSPIGREIQQRHSEVQGILYDIPVLGFVDVF